MIEKARSRLPLRAAAVLPAGGGRGARPASRRPAAWPEAVSRARARPGSL